NTESPAWATPAVGDQRVYFGIGHGRMDQSHENPAGALLCVDTDTGNELWRYPLVDALLAQPVVKGGYVYFGARDKHLYCLERREGKLAWRYDVGSPIVAAPLLARGNGSSVFAVAGDGQTQAKLVCLGLHTGQLHWSMDLAALAQAPLELFSSPTLTSQR